MARSGTLGRADTSHGWGWGGSADDGAGPVGEQLVEGRCRHRAAPVVALASVAAEGHEVVELLGGLDALGHDREADAVAHLDDAVHDGPVGAVGGEPPDERLVDLQHRHRQAAEVAERGVPGAEVVHGQLHADVASSLSRRMASSGPAVSADSVISNDTAPGSTPASATMAATLVARSAWAI